MRTITPSHEKFGFDAKKFYFLFSFDLNSYPERKNPLAVVRAFEAAFADGRDDVGLIFKITMTLESLFGKYCRNSRLLQNVIDASLFCKAIGQEPIYWHYSQALIVLYHCIDRKDLVLGMAEAMLLGKPVIGTAFSGNMEFLTEETGYPVPYQMRLVKEAEYPHATGNSWAEPDVRIAADLMRSVAREQMTCAIRPYEDKPISDSTTARKPWVLWLLRDCESSPSTLSQGNYEFACVLMALRSITAFLHTTRRLIWSDR